MKPPNFSDDFIKNNNYYFRVHTTQVVYSVSISSFVYGE